MHIKNITSNLECQRAISVYQSQIQSRSNALNLFFLYVETTPLKSGLNTERKSTHRL